MTDLRDFLTAGAFWFEDPVLKSGGYDWMDYEGIWNYGICAQVRYEALASCEPETLDCWLADSGNWYLRSSWQEDADYLHMRCGSLGGGHGHFDKGHLDSVIEEKRCWQMWLVYLCRWNRKTDVKEYKGPQYCDSRR